MVKISRRIIFRAYSEGCMIYEDDGLTSSRILERFDNIMQYTGITDGSENLKEVYEGDICKDEHGKLFFIKFEHCGFNSVYNDHCILLSLVCWFEVIGNIYQNTNLLKSISCQKIQLK